MTDRDEALSEVFRKVADPKLATDPAGMVRACTEGRETVRRLLLDLPHEPALKEALAMLAYNLAGALAQQGDHAGAAVELNTALHIYRTLVRERAGDAELSNRLAQTAFNRGNAMLATGALPDGRAMYVEAKAAWEVAVRAKPGNTQYRYDLARCHFNLAFVLMHAGEPAGSLAEYSQAQALLEGLAKDEPERVEIRHDLARSHYNRAFAEDLGPPGEGRLASLAKAREQFEALCSESPEFLPELVRTLEATVQSAMEAAQTLEDRVEPDQLIDCYLIAASAAARQRVVAPAPEADHLAASVYHDLGITAAALHRPDAAEEAFRRALAIWEALSSAHPSDSRFASQRAACSNQLGIVYRSAGRPDVAAAAFTRAIAEREELARRAPHLIDNEVFLAGALCNLGNALTDAFRAHEALSPILRAEKVLVEAVKQEPDGMAARFLENTRAAKERAHAIADRPRPAPLDAGYASARPAGPPAGKLPRGPEFPTGAEAWLERADLARSLDDTRAALADVAHARAARADDPRVAYLEGLVLGRFMQAEAGPVEAFDIPTNDRAIEAFDAAILAHESFFEARLFKARALARSCAAFQAALRICAAKPDLEPHHEMLLARLDACLSRAEESYRAAHRLRPDDPAALRELEVVLAEIERF